MLKPCLTRSAEANRQLEKKMQRYLKKTLIVSAVLAAITLAGLNPADADAGVTVTVTNGSLTVTGTDDADTISVNHHGDGGTTYRVKVTDESGAVTQLLPTDVTGNIFIDAKGGDDDVKFGNENPTYVQQSLTIRNGTGFDTVIVRDSQIGQDLVLDGDGTTRVFRTNIGDDLMGSSGPGIMRTFVTSSTIDDLLQIRATGGGQLMVESRGSEAGRVRITGGNKLDRVELYTNDLGRNPNVNLAGGNDVLFLITDNKWTGNAPVNLGAGDDQVLVDDLLDDGVFAAYRLGRMSLRLGADDDIAFIRAPLTVANTIVDGQGGFDSLQADGLENHPESKASYRNFEEIEGAEPEPALQLDISSANDLRITSTEKLNYLNVEDRGTGYGVYWRVDGSTNDHERIIGGAVRNIIIDAETAYVHFGLTGGETTVNGNVTINATPGDPVSVRVRNAHIGGNLKIVGAGQLDVSVTDTRTDGIFDLRSTSGAFELELLRATFDRTRIVGSHSADAIWSYDGVDLGTAPNINLRNGVDTITTLNLLWDGRLTLLAGGGNDDIIMDGQGAQYGRMRVLMGAGTDRLQISGLADNGSGSILQGDGGEDTLRYLSEPTGATIRSFEVEQPTA